MTLGAKIRLKADPTIVLLPSDTDVLRPAVVGSAFRRIYMSVLLASLFLFGSAARAAAQDSYLLVVTGVAGDDEHAKQFHKWATTLIDAAKTKDERERAESRRRYRVKGALR